MTQISLPSYNILLFFWELHVICFDHTFLPLLSLTPPRSTLTSSQPSNAVSPSLSPLKQSGSNLCWPCSHRHGTVYLKITNSFSWKPLPGNTSLVRLGASGPLSSSLTGSRPGLSGGHSCCELQGSRPITSWRNGFALVFHIARVFNPSSLFSFSGMGQVGE